MACGTNLLADAYKIWSSTPYATLKTLSSAKSKNVTRHFNMMRSSSRFSRAQMSNSKYCRIALTN